MSVALAVAGTVAAYSLAGALAARLGRPALINPVLVAIALVAGVLGLTGTAYDDYFSAAQPPHVLLGPATVALAVPLHRQRARIRAALLPLAAGLATGVVSSVAVALLLPRLLGAPDVLVLSLGPKSATTPVAIGLASRSAACPPWLPRSRSSPASPGRSSVRGCSTCAACATRQRAASRSASPRTGSARRGRSRRATSRARSPGWVWGWGR
jgi:hypothetical protein